MATVAIHLWNPLRGRRRRGRASVFEPVAPGDRAVLFGYIRQRSAASITSTDLFERAWP